MFNRIVLVLVIVPIAVALIALAVANRAPVAFTIDPFNPGNPALTAQLPLFVVVFLAVAAGMIIGSIATWTRQGRYRKQARLKAIETESLKARMAERRPAPAASGSVQPARPALAGPRG